MEENKVETPQAADDLPPIKNYPLYFWRVFRKSMMLFVLGICCILFVVIVFPIMRLVRHNKEKFRKAAHCFMSYASELFIRFVALCKVSEFKISKEDFATLRNLKGCVVVGNHPSCFDTVHFIAFLRNAECVVKANLKKSILSGIVKTVYILNNVDFSIMKNECVQTLQNGGNLIIFPEGTRSPVNGLNQFKKGAARIALAAGANVQPIHIGGNRKYGLGKGEPLWQVNPVERYKYEFKVLPQIDISKYAGLPETIAAKRLTKDIRSAIVLAE